MKSRGERYFVKLARFGASLYDKFLNVEPIQTRMKEIASDLVSKTKKGPLLDVGKGPGRLLFEINLRNPEIELFGLDISASMVEMARNNLKNIPANLQIGSIQRTNYDNNFFSVIACSGSFYLWDYPEKQSSSAELDTQIIWPRCSSRVDKEELPNRENHQDHRKDEFCW